MPADLPRIEIIHELPEHELTCVCGCRKHPRAGFERAGSTAGSQSWMWVQTGGPPDKPVILFDYSTSRAHEVQVRLLEGYRSYLMTDDYAGYNALGAQDGVERLVCRAHARRKFVGAQKLEPKGRTGRADIALKLISKLHRTEIAYKESSDDGRKRGRQDLSCHVMRELKAWVDITLPYVTTQNALGKAVTYLANNWSKL